VTTRVLALDVGTSSVRASLYGGDGDPLPGSAVRLPHQVDYRLDGGVEADADALVALVQFALDQCLRQSAGPVAAVGVSCFWHSLLGLDGDLHPCSPVLMWPDTRSAPDVAELGRRLGDPGAVRERTGCPLHSSFPPAKLLWVRRARPDWWERARHWVSFADYLMFRLTGELVTSVSMASASGLYDQVGGRWDPEVTEATGISAAALPPVADFAEAELRLREATRWPDLQGARWCLPVGDGACNNVGSGCLDPGRIAVMIGTSAAVRRCAPGGPWTVSPALWQYRLDRRRGLVGGALSNGGNLHQWLLATLRLPEGDLEAALAAMPPGGHGLVFLPLLAGERSPGWAPVASGALIGLREATTPLDILRAGLEAVAQSLGALVAEVAAARVGPGDEAPGVQVVGSGGGVWHSPAWAQMVADAIGRDLYRSGEAEPSSRGAALLALEALGLVRDAAELPPPLAGVVRADPQRHARYREGWRRQRHLYELLRADGVVGFAGEGGQGSGPAG
jgi:gluconokinase